MKPQEPNRAPLDPADRLLLEQIRGMATALLDGPARWDALYLRVTDAKVRKLHGKLGMLWSEFLVHVGITEDDWSRIRLAVPICRFLKEAGLPLPKNQGQIEQLRGLRDDREQLVTFCKELVSEFGHLPPARIIKDKLNGGAVRNQSLKKAPPERDSANASSVLPSVLADRAIEFLTCLGSGDHFSANTIGKRLAEDVLSSLGRPIPTGIPFPAHDVPLKPAEFKLDDPRIPVARKARRCPVKKSVGLGGQMLLAIDGDAPPEIREICGISGINSARLGKPESASGTGASAGTPEFRENSGNSEATPSPSTPTVAPLPSVKQGNASTDTAQGASSDDAEIREVSGVNAELGKDVAPNKSATASDNPPKIDAFASGPIETLAETKTPSSPSTGDSCKDAPTVDRDELLSTEFTRAGASVKSAVQVHGGRALITLLVTPGDSSWRDYCPTPPFFVRIPEASSTVRFELVSDLRFAPRAVIEFATKYLLSRGNLDILEVFCDAKMVTEAKRWLADNGRAA